MSCRIVSKVCKTSGESKLWGFDYVRDPDTGELGFLAKGWRPGQLYPINDVVLPNRKFAGLQMKSSGGQSGVKEPLWPTTAGGTVSDGSITWTAEALSNDSLLATITLSAWAVDPLAGLTLSADDMINTNGSQRTWLLVAGGVAGRKYEVKNTITLSNGAVEESALLVEIS